MAEGQAMHCVVVASLSHHAGIWFRTHHRGDGGAQLRRVLLEFVIEHIREPSGGKSDAGESYPFCIVSVVAGQRERAGSVSDRRVYVDGLLRG